jgi:hypothetical protein
MHTRFFTPQVVKTLIFVMLLIAAGALAFHFGQPASWDKSFLFAIKAMTTSGVPDDLTGEVEHFLMLYLPSSVFAWAAMVDALVNRRNRLLVMDKSS